ncbi:MAG: hypothetical protein HY268_23885 [Deltaproteobacteria bacterium]|nr:hypothetical protein [Deltaproteobacteria bacterium]
MKLKDRHILFLVTVELVLQLELIGLSPPLVIAREKKRGGPIDPNRPGGPKSAETREEKLSQIQQEWDGLKIRLIAILQKEDQATGIGPRAKGGVWTGGAEVGLPKEHREEHAIPGGVSMEERERAKGKKSGLENIPTSDTLSPPQPPSAERMAETSIPPEGREKETKSKSPPESSRRFWFWPWEYFSLKETPGAQEEAIGAKEKQRREEERMQKEEEQRAREEARRKTQEEEKKRQHLEEFAWKKEEQKTQEEANRKAQEEPRRAAVEESRKKIETLREMLIEVLDGIDKKLERLRVEKDSMSEGEFEKSLQSAKQDLELGAAIVKVMEERK